MSVNILIQPLNLGELSVLRATPIEPDSEQTTIPISTTHIAHTTQVAERISNMEYEVSGMKKAIVVLKQTILEMKEVQHGQEQDG